MPTLLQPKYNIHYTLEGPENAPLLVFSNSLGADLSMWNTQAAEFAKTYRVLRYDNRGHGESTAPAAPYTLEEVANDAALLIKEVNAGAAHFCGLSLGGMVGMWLASHRPELIRKLILCNTSAFLGHREIWDARIAEVRQGGMQAVVKAVIERWFTEGFRVKSAAAVAKVEQNFLKVSVEGYTGCCAAIRDMNQSDTLSQIKATTLVIAGTHDPSTPPEMGRFIADRIQGSRYAELATAHLSNIEAAATFNDLVSYFIRAGA
jgi:3-oxoadipate enol-lactonase